MDRVSPRLYLQSKVKGGKFRDLISIKKGPKKEWAGDHKGPFGETVIVSRHLGEETLCGYIYISPWCVWESGCVKTNTKILQV